MVEDTVLSLSYGRIVVKPPEKLHGLVPESFETYQIVQSGNIIVRTTDLQNDQVSLRVGYSNDQGIITSAYMCLDTTERISNEFGYQFLNAYDLLKVIYGYGSGLRQNLDFADIKRMPVLVPPKGEQANIVRFLAHADHGIRRYILAKQKLIKLLEEQKWAVIEQAITCGLDPNARLKATGVLWLQNMPEHWAAMRLKFVASEIVDCLHATPVYSPSGSYCAIRAADVRPGSVFTSTARRVDEQTYLAWTKRMKPAEGDILYTREGGSFGNAGLVPPDVQLCISQRMMAFRIHNAYNSAYIMWQINCRHVYGQAASDLIGSAAPHVNVERIKNFWLLIPPRSEQDAIVSQLENETAGVNLALKRAHDQISLARECRFRMIADVVTGKLDVREAAASLPDEVYKPDDAILEDETLEGAEDAELTDEEVIP
jgi:type I restriction enzyme S subunit